MGNDEPDRGNGEDPHGIIASVIWWILITVTFEITLLVPVVMSLK